MKKNKKIWIIIALIILVVLFLIIRCVNATAPVTAPVEPEGLSVGIGKFVDGIFSGFWK